MRLTHFDGQSLDEYLLQMGFEAEGEEAEYSLKHPDNVALLTEMLGTEQPLDRPFHFFSLPARMMICGRCEGKGTHTNPSIDGNGISAEEMHELGDDFKEDYMAGVYDITCTQCKGEKVMKCIDDAAIEPDSAAAELATVIEEYWQGKWEMEAEVAAERRMGA